MDDKMLKPIYVAEKLNVSRSTVHRWIKQGDLKAIKVGNVYRIPESELERILAEGQTDE